MQYNDVTNKQGIVQEIRDLTKTDANSFTIESITRKANLALETYFDIAMFEDNNWRLNDSSYSQYAIATTDLNATVPDVSMPTDLINLVSVKVKTSGGTWKLLEDYTDKDLDIASEAKYANNGEPEFYSLNTTGIIFYPTPNYTSVDGVKIEYTQKPNYFLTTDDTKEVGIPHPKFIILEVAYNQCLKDKKDNLSDVRDERDSMIKIIKKRFSSRGNQRPTRFRPRKENNR